MRSYRNIRTFAEKTLLALVYVGFSGIIQQGEDSLDSPTYMFSSTMTTFALGALFVTSLLTALDKPESKAESKQVQQSDQEPDQELDQQLDQQPDQKLDIAKSVRVNAGVKTAIVLYASSIETLKTLVSSENEQYILYPAFGVFTAILGHRAMAAFKEHKIVDGIALSVMSGSTATATYFITQGDSKGVTIALLFGAGSSAVLAINEAKRQLWAQPAVNSNYRQLDV